MSLTNSSIICSEVYEKIIIMKLLTAGHTHDTRVENRSLSTYIVLKRSVNTICNPRLKIKIKMIRIHYTSICYKHKINSSIPSL